MQGNLRDMAIADLIQHNCLDRKTAQLVIEHASNQATLFFKEGAVIHATLGDNQGEEVIYHILSWQEGQFNLEMGVESPITTISRSWSGLLLEGARRLDETTNLLITKQDKESQNMANIDQTLKAIMGIDGTLSAAIVDWNSGMTLGTIGSGLNIEVAAAGNTNVIRSKMSVMKDLKLKDSIEDILITLSSQYHLLRPLSSSPNLFIYAAFDRSKANLGLARHKLAEIEKDLTV